MTELSTHFTKNHRSRFLRYVLGLLSLTGLAAYLFQLRLGLGVTGLSRDVTWGIYISQFTFLVGIAASSVLVVLPYYVHGKSEGASLLLVGEVVAIVALVEAFAFVTVDLGRPSRVLGVLIYAAPSSLMFWDILALSSYFTVCSGIVILSITRRYGGPTHWLRPIALASVPLAFGIHVVTAMLYSGLVARVGWMTAVVAPKFLATAFTSGAALLLLIAGRLERAQMLRVPEVARSRLAAVMTYSLVASLLLGSLEVFTALYSGLPTAKQFQSHHLTLHGSGFAPWLLVAAGISIVSLLVLLLRDRFQRSGFLESASAGVLLAVFIEKGLVFVPSGFAPNVGGTAFSYLPSLVETLIVLGIHSSGILIALWLLRSIVQNEQNRPNSLPIGFVPAAHDSF